MLLTQLVTVNFIPAFIAAAVTAITSTSTYSRPIVLKISKKIVFILDAIEVTAANFKTWQQDYIYNAQTNEYTYKGPADAVGEMIEAWFEL